MRIINKMIKNVKCYIPDYPRPTFVRESFISLNGVWDFRFDNFNAGENENWAKGFDPEYKINVPFVYQTGLSGINIQKRCDVVWYRRAFNIEKTPGKRHIVHFEGVDYLSKVFINGSYIGCNKGAYNRFSFDVTAAVKDGENIITVRAEDGYSCQQLRGKQRWADKSYDCWYTDTTGIWKTVWLETVSETYLEKVRIKPDFEKSSVLFEGSVNRFKKGLNLRVKIAFGETEVSDVRLALTDETFRLSADIISDADKFKVKYWSFQNPELYDVEFYLEEGGKIIDKAGSYFGMVKYEYASGSINQNDTPIYLKMLLDQGYFPNSGLTPPDEAAIIRDVTLTKRAGFNGVRKHQKIEDDRFYYYCDVLGLASWLEIPSPYQFGETMKDNYFGEVKDIILQHANHPSVMAYVAFNESWGIPRVHTSREEQLFADGAYHFIKALDPSKAVISNDGWDHTTSDIITLHNYAETERELTPYLENLSGALENKACMFAPYRHAFANGYSYKGQPVIISEYAGIAFSKDAQNGSWGYGKAVENEEAFLKRLKGLTDTVKNTAGVSGFCVTQTTDVEQEVNGLFDASRNPKVNIDYLKEIFG
jgi:Beta-galactosidase/beta-glucuronidase